MTTSSERPHAIGKSLSGNDVGDTGGHQAGMYVPKSLAAFFPELDRSSLNPRATIRCTDDDGDEWRFEFIFYNNARFGGTRDEFRLTCMTPYYRRYGLKAGDQVRLIRGQGGRYRISHVRASAAKPRDPVLKLSYSWKVINV